MRMVKNAMYMMIFLLLGGCTTQPNIENAIRIIAYGEGDRSPGTDIEKLTDSNAMERGLVYEFQSGDTIRMSIELAGSLAEAMQTQPIDILLKRKLWLFVNDDGWWTSLDGNDFHRLDKLSDVGGSDSSVGVSLGISKENMSNDLKIRLVLNPT